MCVCVQMSVAKLLFTQVYMFVWSTFLLSLLIIAKGDDDVVVVPNCALLCQLKSARPPRTHLVIHVCVCVSVCFLFMNTVFANV